MEKRVLVALSGGLDSAATVIMLREKGFSVQALYIDMLGVQSLRLRAEHIADQLGVVLHVRQVESRFSETIVAQTLAAHQAGHTPSPCSMCNPQIKWGVLCEVADELGIFHVATGHYVQVEEFVRCGVDPIKDQSYYLWSLDARVRVRALTPLGGYTKLQVRQYLAAHGYSDISTCAESMSLCFLLHCGKAVGYSDFLKLNLPVIPGDVVDVHSGQVVGRHSGYQLYTVGQKRGFELFACSTPVSANASAFTHGHISAHVPAYTVVRVDPVTNALQVTALPAELWSHTLYIRDFVLHELADFSAFSDVATIPASAITEMFVDRVQVKVRGLGRNPQGLVVRASVSIPASTHVSTLSSASFSTSISHSTLILELDTSFSGAWAVAPGQPAVFYVDDRVVGGGVLCSGV